MVDSSALMSLGRSRVWRGSGRHIKGVIFNLLEDFIAEGWGEQALDEILSDCPLHTKEPFVGPGTYPDADLFSIAGAAARKLGVPLSDAVRAFGRYLVPKLLEKYPVFDQGHVDTKSFLQSVDGVIHVEVHKLMPKAVTPRFTYEDVGEGQLRIRYESERKLCHLMEGMLEAAAAHFGETLHYEQSKCLHAGDSHCEFELTFGVERSRVA